MLPVILGLLGLSVATTEPALPVHLVACAPGYPGSTEQAQPTMDEFAALLSRAADWDTSAVTAEYHEDEAAGVARLRDPDTHVALVPLPLFFKYEEELGLEPIAQTVGPEGTRHETWSLVAAAGRVAGPAQLDGWTVTGVPAYAEAFVRGNVLGQWGALPASAAVEFTDRALGALRRAMAGDDIAVLLDRAQVQALASLPDPESLEVLVTSPEMSMGLIVNVGGRLEPTLQDELREALFRINDSARFGELLEMVRVSGFGPVDDAMVAAGRTAFRSAR